MKPTIKTSTNKQFKSIEKAMDKQWTHRETTELELLTELASQFQNRQWIRSINLKVGNIHNPAMSLILSTISGQFFKITYSVGSDNTISKSELKNITI